MIVHHRSQNPQHHADSGTALLLDLVLKERSSLSQDIQDGEGNAEDEIAGEGEQHWEEWRRDQGVVAGQQVVPQGLKKTVRSRGVWEHLH